MFCKSCGKENAPGAAFCSECGKPLYDTAYAAEPAQAVQKLKRKTVIAIVLVVLSVVFAAMLTLTLLGVFDEAGRVVVTLISKSFEPPEGAAADGDITASTIVREPLPEGCVNETGYYTDELGLLNDGSGLLPGLNYFYNKTGVQPYVYLTGAVNGSSDTPSMDDMRAFAESKYMELFTDDAHVLLVLFENDYSYRYWYTIGPGAKSVIDEEAGYILGNYIDMYYTDLSLTYEQFFSKVFSEAADRIMSVTKAD